MTVLGGLQLGKKMHTVRGGTRFNTDDGIRRATTAAIHFLCFWAACFNTDDGIRRATTLCP